MYIITILHTSSTPLPSYFIFRGAWKSTTQLNPTLHLLHPCIYAAQSGGEKDNQTNWSHFQFMITSFKWAFHVTGDLTIPPGSILNFFLSPQLSHTNFPILTLSWCCFLFHGKNGRELSLESYHHMPLPASTCSDILYLPTMPHLCPRSLLLLPTWWLCSGNALPSLLQHQLFSNSTCPKLNSWSPTVSFSTCSLPHLSGGKLHLSSFSSQKPWSHPWLLSSHPTSDLSGNPIGSTFKLYPEYDHFSPHPLLPKVTSVIKLAWIMLPHSSPCHNPLSLQAVSAARGVF